MPCPHSGPEKRSKSASRRDFVKAAVAIGGTSALSACAERENSPAEAAGTEPPERQHAWNDYLPRDAHGNTVAPYHQVILLLEYSGEGTPGAEEQRTVEAALESLDQAYQWGNGGANPQQPEGSTTRGVFSMLGYSRRYFDRFEADLPDSIDLPRPETTLERLGEDPSVADQADASLLLSSDYGEAVLGAEAALFGRVNERNEVDFEGSLGDVFDVVDRRTGFIGSGVPRQRLDREEIPQSSPLTMGFKSGFQENQASEDSVTIQDGPFSGGTTQHLSRLQLDLDSWYAKDDETRVHQMFSPAHSRSDVGESGEFLTNDSGMTEELAARTDEYARHRGAVGHTQKTARARTESFEPRILRRSEAMQTDREGAGFNFTAVQRTVADFRKTREAMNGDDLDLAESHSGILEQITVKSRGNYLIPPRSKRALPEPNPR
mgnify:CR=1 FL=1